MSQVALGMRIWSLVAYQSSHKEAWRRAEPGGKPTGKPIPQPVSDAQISRSMQGLALRGRRVRLIRVILVEGESSVASALRSLG
jgi:hypothetical protein